MKGKRSVLVAGVLAVLAALLGHAGMRRAEADARAGWTLVPVLVAAADLEEGTVITLETVERREVPEQFASPSVIKPDALSYVLEQRVRVPLHAGDPLLWTQFEDTRTLERLSGKIPKQGRAVTLEANVSTSVGGWLRPNDHVDVIGTFRDPQTNDPVAVTLLQNVIVLATGKLSGSARPDRAAERDFAHVSLLVLPEEAEILALAKEQGRLSLSLRHEEDVDLLEGRGRSTIGTLLSGERAKALEERRREIIPIIKGGDRASWPRGR